MDATTTNSAGSITRDAYLSRMGIDVGLFAAAARAVGPDAKVPTCPEWTMRELLLHQGEVHRWAGAVVRNRVTKLSDQADDYLGPLPDDDQLVAWFESGAADLIATLRAAPADVQCATFLADPPPPVLFWSRRQTHETAMHRVDAESATGTITPFVPEFAADGIDEMLAGFVPRKHTPLHADPPVTLAVRLADAHGAWHLTISDAPPATVREGRPADCIVSGSASDVYLALWNRQGVESLDIEGDPAVLELFRENVRVRWS